MFNGGIYYRPVGDNMYECEYCFNKPIRDQEERGEEERRGEEKRRDRGERRRGEEKRRDRGERKR